MSERKVIAKTFVTELTAIQPVLYAEIVALLGNAEDAKDVLQETNLTLWQKAEEYDESRPFLPWARGFVFWQVKKFRLRMAREQSNLTFDSDIFDKVAEALEEDGSADGLDEERLAALEHCLQTLSAPERLYITLRYMRNLPLAEVAQKAGKNVSAMAAFLYRVRKALADCILRRICNIRSGASDRTKGGSCEH